jgi:hypothetical protein
MTSDEIKAAALQMLEDEPAIPVHALSWLILGIERGQVLGYEKGWKDCAGEIAAKDDPTHPLRLGRGNA